MYEKDKKSDRNGIGIGKKLFELWKEKLIYEDDRT